MRCVTRALGALLAVFATVPGLLLALPSAPAAAAVSAPAPAAAARQQPLAISITGMTPRYAVKGSTVRLSGTLANHTGSSLTGIGVQAYTAGSVITTRSELAEFTAGSDNTSQMSTVGSLQVTGTVRDGQTVRWSAQFPADELYTQFGDYPVRVLATSPGQQYQARASTALPYWPSTGQPKKLQTAWVWPLVDAPQQGACRETLATPGLSRSVAAGGRLDTLLGAGAAAAQSDDLTWDIDPALLSDVSVMTQPYRLMDGGSCPTQSQSEQPASKAATAWLAKLKTATAGAPAFLTPYANVDAATLSHAGLNANLHSAYQLGQSVAGQMLPQTFGAKGTGGEGTQVLRAAWPADGLADAGVLTSLANQGGVSTVVLAGGQLPSATPHYENALARTTSSTGTPMSALLADTSLTSLLGTASAKTATPSGQFALTQDFLAQTAMISNEAPASARSLVIAPPPSWDPSPTEAQALLAVAHQDAPWLKATGLSALAAQAAKLPSETPQAKSVSGAELRPGYLSSLRTVNASLSLFQAMLFQPPASLTTRLEKAAAGTESSAWRGRGAAGGVLAISRLSGYLSRSEGSVKIVSGQKILLAGASAVTPVSVTNGLREPVQVQVVATTPAGSPLTVESSKSNTLLTVQAGKTGTAKLRMSSATIGTTTVRLQLVTRDGLPVGSARSLSVEATRVGRFLLTIIGVALGILVLTSVYRLRRKRLARARPGGTGNNTPDAGGAG